MNRMLAVANWTFLEARGKGEVLALLAVGVLCIGLMAVMMLSNPIAIEEQSAAPAGREQAATEKQLPQEEADSQADDLKSMIGGILGSEDKFTLAALGYSVFFVSFIAVLLASNILKEDLDSGVLASILTKPVTRAEYLFGKYVGLNMVVLLAWGVLAVLLMIVAAAAGRMSVDILLTALGEAVKLLVLTALIFRFSLQLPRIAAGFLGLAWFLAGLISPKVLHAAQIASAWYIKALFHAVHVLLPPMGQLTYFGDQEKITGGSSLIDAPEPGIFLIYVLWALAWAGLLLWLAGRRFRKMEV